MEMFKLTNKRITVRGHNKNKESYFFKEKKLIRNAQTVSVISKILLPSNVQGLSRFLNVVEILAKQV